MRPQFLYSVSSRQHSHVRFSCMGFIVLFLNHQETKIQTKKLQFHLFFYIFSETKHCYKTEHHSSINMQSMINDTENYQSEVVTEHSHFSGFGQSTAKYNSFQECMQGTQTIKQVCEIARIVINFFHCLNAQKD